MTIDEKNQQLVQEASLKMEVEDLIKHTMFTDLMAEAEEKEYWEKWWNGRGSNLE